MKLKELLARAFFFTRLGYGAYINWWVGAIAYITIIYELVLKQVLPPSIITYLLIFIGLMLVSFLTGLIAARKGIYGVEHKINTETNPYINIPIGSKEILNYQSQIAALKREIQNYEVQKAICEALNLKEKIPILEQNIESTEEYRAKMEDMLNKAVI
jgi:hypothetical protein